MRVPLVTPLSAVCVAAAALTASSNASAHYYALVESANITNGDADDGDYILIQTNILHNTCNILTHEFVNHELWYTTDLSGNYWVEVGFKDGETNGIDCVTDIDFWADSRPGGGYNEHHPDNGWSFGSWYAAEITLTGSCTWNIELGGLSIGTSTSNCPGSGRYLTAGIETTSQSSGSAQGFLTDWWEQNSSGIWNQGWDGAFMRYDNPPNIEQVANSQWGLQTEEVLNEPF
jgi:hypothetical protein